MKGEQQRPTRRVPGGTVLLHPPSALAYGERQRPTRPRSPLGHQHADAGDVVLGDRATLEANKPPTEAGKKLSIMGYRTLPDGSYRAPPLAVFIQKPYKPRRVPCGVCGRAQRATKATGSDWLLPASAPETSHEGAVEASVPSRRRLAILNAAEADQ